MRRQPAFVGFCSSQCQLHQPAGLVQQCEEQRTALPAGPGHCLAVPQWPHPLLLVVVLCRALHGDIAQAQREATLAGFRTGKFSVLVATDVAARGLDISGVELVIQVGGWTCSLHQSHLLYGRASPCSASHLPGGAVSSSSSFSSSCCQMPQQVEPPKDPETYIHRSGRTGRAGHTGVCITLVGRKHEERIPFIEKRAGEQAAAERRAPHVPTWACMCWRRLRAEK